MKFRKYIKTGLLGIMVFPIITSISCSQKNKIISRHYEGFSSASKDLWNDYSILENIGNFKMVYIKDIDVTIANQYAKIKINIKKGNSREQALQTIENSIQQLQTQKIKDMNLLTILYKDYLWNMVVLSRMPKNGKYDLNLQTNSLFPRIIATKIEKDFGILNYKISFELSDGKIISNLFNLQSGPKNHLMTISNKKWNSFSWTIQPNNKVLSFDEVYNRNI